MDERQDVIGFLGGDGVLYCSQACVHKVGHSAGREVDQDEYDALIGENSTRSGTTCPGCGADFPVDWPDREPS